MTELSEYGNIPVSAQVLAEGLVGYNSPKDKISSLEREGNIIRIRNGLYVVSNRITNQNLSLELIANHLYGPSYISFESALSYHNLIPERVYVTRSASMGRGRSYETPLGKFTYTRVPEEYFSIGIQLVNREGRFSYLIASPEKALCDLILGTRRVRIQSARAMHNFLLDDMRIDIEFHENWDLSVIEECIETGRKRSELELLLTVLRHG